MSVVFILGGSGNTGRRIAKLLLEYTDARIILGARNELRLKETAEELHAHTRVSWHTVDASRPGELSKYLEPVDLLVVASPLSGNFGELAQEAMRAECDVLDTIYSSRKLAQLTELAGDLEAAGRCFITDAGFHPGLPAALVRYAAGKMDTLSRADVYSVIRDDWAHRQVASSTRREFVEELLSMDMTVFRDGTWRKAGMTSTRYYRKEFFASVPGTFLCAPMMFEEMRTLPHDIPGLADTGFYIAGFHWYVDYVVMPLVLLGLKTLPSSCHPFLASWFFRSLCRVSKPPFCTALKLVAEGFKNGAPYRFSLELSHEDGYWFTATPVTSCIKQYLDGSLKKPGLNFMGRVVDPDRTLRDLGSWGISSQENDLT